ncbi:TPA: FRG domain-containing protein [Staphylococcus aureus]|nr:FRG domain-containing protein [Staphylococcus aureus]
MNIYKEIKEKNNKVKLYNDIKFKLIIIPNEEKKEKMSYDICDFEMNCENSDNDNLNKKSEIICNNLKSELNKCKTHNKEKSWQIFYFIKEFIQSLDLLEEFNFNYFRGQRSNWKVLPGLLRDSTNKEYINHFEQEYKRLAYNYPEELSYLPYDKNNRLERANYLSILQHYGMQTSLLDITKNPFIALLFMVSEENKNKINKPSFILYEIDENIHHESHLFIRVIKDANNKRIEAQRGAFLCYDYLYSLNITDIKRINRIILDMEVSKDKYVEKLKKDIEIINQLKKEYENSEEKKDSDFNNIVNEAIEFRKTLLENLEIPKDANEKIDECYEELRKEMLTKLKEYHYFENQLYPDLDKQIAYILSKYNDQSSKKYISDL